MSLKALIASVRKGQVLLPVLQDFIADQNRKLRSGELSRRKQTIIDSKLTIQAMRQRIEEFNHGEKIEGDYFHPSALGTCLRLVWFGYYKAPAEKKSKEDELKEYLIFEVGSYFHILMQNLLQRSGVLTGREIAIKSRHSKIIGHCDAVVEIDGVEYVVELKTINSRNFILLGNEPKVSHLQQVHAYMRVLGLSWGIILYFDKDRHTVREFVVPFDKDFYKEHVEKRIKYFFQCVHDHTPPKREGESAVKPPCSWCPFVTLCYSSFKLEKFVRKIQNETEKSTGDFRVVYND